MPFIKTSYIAGFFKIDEFHTRFNKVEFFVCDTRKTDKYGLPTVIGQWDSLDKALSQVERLS